MNYLLLETQTQQQKWKENTQVWKETKHSSLLSQSIQNNNYMDVWINKKGFTLNLETRKRGLTPPTHFRIDKWIIPLESKWKYLDIYVDYAASVSDHW